MLALQTPIEMYHELYELTIKESDTICNIYNELFKSANLKAEVFTDSEDLYSVDIIKLCQTDGRDVRLAHWYELVQRVIIPKAAELLGCSTLDELYYSRQKPRSHEELIIWIEELFLEIKHTL